MTKALERIRQDSIESGRGTTKSAGDLREDGKGVGPADGEADGAAEGTAKHSKLYVIRSK